MLDVYASRGMSGRRETASMYKTECTRRSFFKRCAGIGVGAGALSTLAMLPSCLAPTKKRDLSDAYDALYSTAKPKTDIVSIVEIRKGNTAKAVEEAIDLLGGMSTIAKGKSSALLKPNLVSEARQMTTKVEVVEAIVRTMKRAGLDVAVAEGTAATALFNHIEGEDYRTWDSSILDGLQKKAFDDTGYTALSNRLKVPLVNLHTGRMITHGIENSFVFDEIQLHESLHAYDLFCSVPMMKTHQLATVTLSMKNLFGIIPGSVYGSVRGHVHDLAARKDKTGTDSVIVDLCRARPIDLAIVDASESMDGNGPTHGRIVKTNLIVAGTNGLAVDMISALTMGFSIDEVSTFAWAHRAGMTPGSLFDIEIRGENISRVARTFVRPVVYPWVTVGQTWGHKTLSGIGSTGGIGGANRVLG